MKKLQCVKIGAWSQLLAISCPHRGLHCTFSHKGTPHHSSWRLPAQGPTETGSLLDIEGHSVLVSLKLKARHKLLLHRHRHLLLISQASIVFFFFIYLQPVGKKNGDLLVHKLFFEQAKTCTKRPPAGSIITYMHIHVCERRVQRLSNCYLGRVEGKHTGFFSM